MLSATEFVRPLVVNVQFVLGCEQKGLVQSSSPTYGDTNFDSIRTELMGHHLTSYN